MNQSAIHINRNKKKSCLIVEGGGFKTGFTTGVLDAFLTTGYQPFNEYIAISGGTVAMSYFLSKQYRSCLKAIKILAKDKKFMNYRRTLGETGYMDIDFIAQVAQEKIPFDIDRALSLIQNCNAYFVATSRVTGSAKYIQVDKNNWIDAAVASCTLPFVTKGKHYIGNEDYLDGGWSDPLPVKWAYEQGARHITILRTWPLETRVSQTWTDYFGSIYFRSSAQLKHLFECAHDNYNNAVEFLENPPEDLIINQIAPIKLLKSGTFSYTQRSIMLDYRYGLDRGIQYVQKKR